MNTKTQTELKRALIATATARIRARQQFGDAARARPTLLENEIIAAGEQAPGSEQEKIEYLRTWMRKPQSLLGLMLNGIESGNPTDPREIAAEMRSLLDI